jgi:hypothetical protein
MENFVIVDDEGALGAVGQRQKQDDPVEFACEAAGKYARVINKEFVAAAVGWALELGEL